MNLTPKSISTGIRISSALAEPLPEHPMKRLMLKKHMADLGLGEPALTPYEQALYDAWCEMIEREDENDQDE